MDATPSFPIDSPLRLVIARLGRSRLAISLVGLGAIAVAAAWQWSWLVAIGAAPVLLSAAPCAAMCGLGLCMRRIGYRSCGAASMQAPAMQANPGGIKCLTDRTLTKESPTHEGEVTLASDTR